MGPLEDGAGGDAATPRIVDALVDRVAGVRQDGREWLELELVRGRAGR